MQCAGRMGSAREGLAVARESKHRQSTKELRVTGPELARWLGVSGKIVYELAKEGIVVRATREEFLLEESIRRYCEHIRQTAAQRGECK
jgi:phage terminase Nu1 subunit (DNA packaging protein)